MNNWAWFAPHDTKEKGVTDVVFQVKAPRGGVVRGAALLAAYPDGRFLTGQTDAEGECRLDLYRTDQKMKVLAAAEGHLPFHTTVVPGTSETVPLELEPSTKERKAALFTRRTGYVPGISGLLNPHKDGYVYGDNIAINGRLANPAARFEIGEALHLIDVYGIETTIRFLVVEGEFSLIEYTDPKAYGGE